MLLTSWPKAATFWSVQPVRYAVSLQQQLIAVAPDPGAATPASPTSSYWHFQASHCSQYAPLSMLQLPVQRGLETSPPTSQGTPVAASEVVSTASNSSTWTRAPPAADIAFKSKQLTSSLISSSATLSSGKAEGKQPTSNRKGKWTSNERRRFEKGLAQFGVGHWALIARVVGTRTTEQVSRLFASGRTENASHLTNASRGKRRVPMLRKCSSRLDAARRNKKNYPQCTRRCWPTS